MAGYGKATNAEIYARIEKCRDIIEEIEAKHKTVTDKAIYEQMKQYFDDYTIHKAHEDKLKVFQETQFIQELGSHTFSHEVKKIFEDLDNVRESTYQLIEETDENAKFRNWTVINANKLLKDAAKTRAEILEGKALKVSVELLARELEKLKEKEKQRALKSSEN